MLGGDKHNLRNDQAMQIIDLVFDRFANTLISNGRIEIRGFGSFAMKEYGTYKGRNPRTGNIVQVKPKKLPVFKVGKELKGMVDGK